MVETNPPAKTSLLENQHNDDWEATCSIYSDLKVSATTRYQCSGSSSVVVRSIDILLAAALKRITFCRALSPDFETYRVWTLPPTQYPVLRLSFLYENNSSESLPHSLIQMDLLTNYPHTWPEQPGTAWLMWLKKHALECLQTDAMSYSVCNWVEHHAMDYFCGSIAYERDGFCFTVFADPGPTFYDVESLVITTTPTGPAKLVKHLPNGRRTQRTDPSTEFSQQQHQAEEGQIHPIVLNKDAWYPRKCAICLDSYLLEEMETTTCGHAFCKPCLSLYLSHKVEEIQTHRDNPFRCPLPSCRMGLQIVGCVKQYLSNEKMDQVRAWYKDLKHPTSLALPNCISKACSRNGTMRKESVDSIVVQCEACQKRWCEWCLKKLESDEAHHLPGIHHHDDHHDNDNDTNICDATLCVQFCQRYLTASPQARAACEAKWPWIAIYARSRIDLDMASTWLTKNHGQICPVCKNGVERSEGCFHIHCTCGAHFCYECGAEIFYPFYGTHHCWER
jgi:hypothetical protein